MERVKLFPRPSKRSPLLPTELAEEYECDRSRIEDAIDPCDAIEQIYCEDFVYDRLQMRRLQRWNLATVKAELAEAVYAVCSSTSSKTWMLMLSSDNGARIRLPGPRCRPSLPNTVLMTQRSKQKRFVDVRAM